MQPHPKGLWVLSMVEIWERFSFYLMRALLVFYATEKLGFSSGDAANLVGSYMMMVYFAPILGGHIADRYLGFLKAAFLGGFVMALGHAAMVIESRMALYVAMGLIAIGNGFFKPSMQCLVRGLYPAGDERIDSAFSTFYVAVNVGAGLAVVGAALLRKHFGFHVAFGGAGVGLLLGLLQAWIFRKHIEHAAHGSSLSAITHVDVAEPRYQDRVTLADARRRIWAIIGLTGAAVVFWMASLQDGATLPLWARDNIARGTLSPEWFSAINPVGIILMTAPLVLICNWLRIGTATKFVLGLLLASAAFALMSYAAWQSGAGLAHWGWLVGGYAVLTIGELLVSPSGSALVGKLAPPKYLGILTGVWLLASSIGGKLAGRLGLHWDTWAHSGFFGVIALVTLAAAGLALIARPWLQGIIDQALKPAQLAVEPKRMATVIPLRKRAALRRMAGR